MTEAARLELSLVTLLATVDTPTVCNAIEVAQGRRGFDRFTRSTVLASDPSAKPLFGFARTARIRGRNPPAENPEAVRERRMTYYLYMANSPRPAVAVIEDLDWPEAVGAFWGEVNTTVHKGLGIAGAVTNGVMRDLGDLVPGFPVIAGSIGPSHAFVHVVDIDVPVRVFGLPVQPGEFIHADRHGAVIVPHEVLPKLREAILTAQNVEKYILEPARQPDFDFRKFQVAWRTFEDART